MKHAGGQDLDQAEDRRSEIPMDTFPARLLLARHHAGKLSQREAAEKCGLNYASWSNWEEGRQPRDLLDVVDAISEGLGIDRDWLLFGGPLAKPEIGARRRMGARLRRPNGSSGILAEPAAPHAIRGTSPRGATRSATRRPVRTGRPLHTVPDRSPVVA